MAAAAKRRRYRQIANRARRLPGVHGLRPWRVYADVGSWSSSAGHPFGEGTRTDTETELLETGQPPRVRELSDERVALGGGEKGDLSIGPITPIEGSAWATLTGSGVTPGDSWRVRLVHDETGDVKHCVVKSISQDRALHVMLTVRPVRTNS
jgi:hypothetical protein